MKIGVSNLSWSAEDEKKNVEIVKLAGYDYIESVYSKISDDIPVVAIQSIFYGSGIERVTDERCLPYIAEVIKTCKSRGIEVITFGSPSMRIGNKSDMISFLLDVDQLLDGTNIKFCIEPNAKYYGAEYYNTLESIVEDLHLFKNIKSMIDVGNSIMEGQDCLKEYKKYGEYVFHVHFATPGLYEITDFRLYRHFYKELVGSGYTGYVSYEFLKAEDTEAAIKDFYREIAGKEG